MVEELHVGWGGRQIMLMNEVNLGVGVIVTFGVGTTALKETHLFTAH